MSVASGGQPGTMERDSVKDVYYTQLKRPTIHAVQVSGEPGLLK